MIILISGARGLLEVISVRVINSGSPYILVSNQVDISFNSVAQQWPAVAT